MAKVAAFTKALRRAILPVVAVMLIAGLAAPAAACPACTGPGPKRSLVEEIAGYQTVVVAKQQSSPRSFVVASLVKGAGVSPGDRVEVNYGDLSLVPLEQGKPTILGRHVFLNKWMPLASISAGAEGWLRMIAALPRDPGASPDGWNVRLDAMTDDLWSAEPIFAETAAREFAQAPYAALREIGKRFDAGRLIQLANQPGYPSLVPIVLIGAAGGVTAKTFIANRIDAALAGGDPTELGALLTALIEIDGAAALDFIGGALFETAGRNVEQMRAGLTALVVHAGAGGKVSRGAILDRYALALARHPELAGYAAADMQALEEWSFAEKIAKAAAVATLDEGSRLMLNAFLKTAAASRDAPPARSTVAKTLPARE